MTINQHQFRADQRTVFGVLIDPETYPEWLVGAKHIRDVSPRWPEPGSDFRHVVGFGPLEVPDRTTLLEVDAPHRLVLKVRARPVIEAVVTFELTPEAEGCALRMTESPLGIYKLIAPISQPLVKARNAKSMSRLDAVVARRSSATSV